VLVPEVDRQPYLKGPWFVPNDFVVQYFRGRGTELTLRGVAQARHAGRDRCRVRVYATGGFTFNSTHRSPRMRVSLPQEETEFRSDGTNRVSLARVSVLRGVGPKEGIPFIDDLIHTSDVIVDYLTEFFGIKCTFPSPLSASLRRTLGTPRSRRLGSALVKAHVDTAETCVHEAAIARRPGMHIYRPRPLQGFPDHQSVPCLSVTFQGSF
jgi:hypothetical protein